MSNEDLHQRLETWLAEERRGAEAAAERALAGLFAMLARPEPSTGFAGRVLARIAVPELQAAPWVIERLVAGLFFLALVAVWALPRWLATAWQLIGGLDMAAIGAALGGAGRRAVDLVGLWARLVEKARWVDAFLTSPDFRSLLLVSALLSAILGRVLYHLLEERSSHHVEAQGGRL